VPLYRRAVHSSTALLAALSGLGLGLSLIVAIGAQNAFVLRQGLRGEHLALVVAVCVLSDAVLIVAGVAGGGAVLDRVPWLLPAVRLGGAAFLLGYGLIAARRALHPGAALESGDTTISVSLAATLTTCLLLTWLNPHVYLDTVVLLGSIAQTHGEQRWWFTAGAATGSLLWFCALGYGARLLRPVFSRPTAWRVLDALFAIVMTTLALTLALGLGLGT
jgi:L-lysine exporter family protein LysE/ArgO